MHFYLNIYKRIEWVLMSYWHPLIFESKVLFYVSIIMLLEFTIGSIVTSVLENTVWKKDYFLLFLFHCSFASQCTDKIVLCCLDSRSLGIHVIIDFKEISSDIDKLFLFHWATLFINSNMKFLRHAKKVYWYLRLFTRMKTWLIARLWWGKLASYKTSSNV